MTFHKAQGATVGETFVLGTEGLNRERAYSGLLRGTDANYLYIADATDRATTTNGPLRAFEVWAITRVAVFEAAGRAF